jgi:hypothetical protein
MGSEGPVSVIDTCNGPQRTQSLPTWPPAPFSPFHLWGLRHQVYWCGGRLQFKDPIYCSLQHLSHPGGVCWNIYVHTHTHTDTRACLRTGTGALCLLGKCSTICAPALFALVCLVSQIESCVFDRNTLRPILLPLPPK